MIQLAPRASSAARSAHLDASSTGRSAQVVPPASTGQAAGAGYRPSFDLGPADASRAVSLLRAALVAEPPTIIVNRKIAGAIGLLERGGSFRTGHDYPTGQLTDKQRLYMDRRNEAETRLGLLGEGVLRGKTVYGSVQWPDTRIDPGTGTSRPGLGVTRTYGSAALVLDPSVWSRATVTPDDSFFVEPHQVGTATDLPSVILDSIPRTQLAELVERSDESFVAGVRAHLRDLQDRSGYIEAQVPAAHLSEVREIRVDLDRKHLRSDDDLALLPRLVEVAGRSGMGVVPVLPAGQAAPSVQLASPPVK